MRAYPAIDVTWPHHPGVEVIERLQAELDDHRPVAVEDLPTGTRVFFGDASDRDLAAARVAASGLNAHCVALDVPDDDWAARSQASLGPVRVGRLIVTPPWASPQADPGIEDAAAGAPLVIVIRPAMGFGSGHHASTRLALELLQRAPVAGAHVLDAGTGSGVLALAAWRLGAASATGFDHDRDALASARESVDLNPGADAVALVALDLSDATRRLSTYDVVTANLTGELLVRSAETLSDLARPDGSLILSGILADEASAVLAAFAARAWRLIDRVEEDEWVGLMLGRTPAPTSPSASTGN